MLLKLKANNARKKVASFSRNSGLGKRIFSGLNSPSRSSNVP